MIHLILGHKVILKIFQHIGINLFNNSKYTEAKKN